MSSSISSSDPRSGQRWRRFLRTYLVALLAVCGLCAAAVLIIDPYNTGMLTPFDRAILQTFDSPRFGNAARGRDPQFDSAIFGNSTAQLLEPERLDRLVGGRFVTLVLPGAGPLEQLTMIEYFLRHHGGRARTLVVAMDTSWCKGDELFTRDRIPHPFPFWIYDGNRLVYAARIMTIEGIGVSLRKLQTSLGWKPPLAREDGYQNFEQGRMWRIDEAWKRLEDKEHMPWLIELDTAAIDRFAALDALDRVIAGVSEQTKVVLLFTPYFSGALPADDARTRRLQGCKARVAEIAGIRNVIYRDFLQDDAMTREAANFWDPVHYRIHIGRLIENEIAGAAKVMPTAR